ncbi:hypothetical protein PHYPO_G00229810 [Pangasianodon hypophthalmus]|uniref:Uncharacterized protein n=1 Tax=Pangasianodon hypophthalmus TaxID=310915 RepID=A0A5N5NJT9_PANHP|nr:hypothetical protein PHYPO_G00229810 [Pangasianodon hypophthalmus]
MRCVETLITATRAGASRQLLHKRPCEREATFDMAIVLFLALGSRTGTEPLSLMEFYAVQRALDGIFTPQLDGTPADRYRLTGTPFSFQIATERPGRSGLDAKLPGRAPGGRSAPL